MHEFFQAALSEARKSSYKVPMGAVVVYKNKIVGRGCNIAHSTGEINDGIHAEIAAINDATAKYRKDSILVVGRTNKNDELAIAKPCQSCETILKKLGVKRVWFSTETGWQRMDLNNPNPKSRSK